MTDLLDAVAAATAGVSELYPVNGVPPSPEYPYGSYSAGVGRGDSYTLDSSHGVRWVGVTVQTFGKTEDSALSLMEDVDAALLDQVLNLGGTPTTPFRASLDSPAVSRDPNDNGVVTATQHFRATRRRNA